MRGCELGNSFIATHGCTYDTIVAFTLEACICARAWGEQVYVMAIDTERVCMRVRGVWLRCGVVSIGVVSRRVAWRGAAWRGVVLCIVVWCGGGLVLYGVAWRGVRACVGACEYACSRKSVCARHAAPPGGKAELCVTWVCAAQVVPFCGPELGTVRGSTCCARALAQYGMISSFGLLQRRSREVWGE